MRLALLLVLLPLASAANPRRVADLNETTATRSGRPNFFVTAGQRTFFAATDAFGNELWVTDGTGPGTRRVADINPGSASSLPNPIGAIGNEVVFAATRPDVGRELFISDGTAAGTRLLKDVEPGAASGVQTLFNANPGAELTGLVLFAGGPVSDQELWRTDGTTAGTVRIADLSGTGGSAPRQWERFGNRVVFVATGASGAEAYVTDGTAVGTVLIGDLNPGPPGSSPGSFTALNSWLYFIANDGTNGPELWRWNGVAAPARLSTIASPPSAFMRILATQTFDVWFGGDGPAGDELFRFDTIGMTVTAYDVNPGPASSSPRVCSEISLTMYCVFNGDGMSADVFQVGSVATPMADLNPGPQGADATFVASASTNLLLGVFTGTERRLISLRAFGQFTDLGLTVDQAESVGGSGSSIFVAANDGVTGDELWSVTAFGNKRLVRDLWAGTGSSLPGGFIADGDRALFAANPLGQGFELFETRGTAATTRPLTSMLGFGGPPALYLLGPRLAVRTGSALWGADRVTGGSWDVLVPTSGGTPAVLNSVLYFSGTSPATGYELWRSDGTVSGTRLAAEVAPGMAAGLVSSAAILALPTGVVFTANDGTSGAEPWFSDGTQAGTRRLADLNAGPGSSNPFHLTRAGDRAFFFANTPATGSELYVTDGAVTSLVADAVAGTGSLPGLNAMVGATDRVYFLSSADVWASDGTAANTRRVATAVTVLGSIATAGPKAFFSGLTPSQGRELWVSDGTIAGTTAIDVAAGLPDSSPTSLYGIGAEVLFAANGNDGAGIELWRSDGTVAGTRRVADLATGAPDSTPRNFGRVGSRVYFSATDLDGDEELWVYELDSTPPTVTAMVTGTPGLNGFYVSDVTLRFVVDEPESTAVPGPGCDGVVLTADTAGRAFSCTVTSAGGMATAMATLKRDVTPPVVTCPADLVVEATSPGGTMVTLTPATAVDNIETTPGVDAQPRSGSVFPLGTTLVTETATDGAGNASTCKHAVTVRDTTAPVPMCPADMTLDGNTEAGGVVRFGVSATDSADASPLVLSDHASGSLFPDGETTVTVTAIDRSGNAGRCTFKVTMSARRRGCGCSGAPGGALALLLLAFVRRTSVGRGRCPPPCSSSKTTRTCA